MIDFRQAARVDTLRSVGLSPREMDDHFFAWAQAHATGVILSLGIMTGAAGCTGGSTEPAVSETPQPAAPKVVDASRGVTPPKRGGAIGSPSELQLMPPAGTEVTEEVKENKVARDAFQVLVTPGSDPAAWEAAQKQLIDLGPDAIPVLLSGLGSTNAIERETAATVCALTGAADSRVQTALLMCLADESSFVRANAAAALAQIPEHQAQVMATLTDLLADSDPQLRRMAAANLGSFGEEASAELPKLTAVLADNDAEVVTPVIQLLGRMGPSAVEAVPQLQKIAFEQDGELRQAAEQALLLIQTDTADNSKPGE